MESFAGVLGWLSVLAALIGASTLGCLLVTLLQVASGAGTFAGDEIPSGVARRAEAVEARIRARYRPQPEAVPALAERTPEADPEPVSEDGGAAVPQREPLAA